MYKSTVIACLLGLAFAAPKWHELNGYSFEKYVKDFGKEYTVGTEEFYKRKLIFENELVSILAHNRDHTQTWKQGVNRFTDYTPEEIQESMKGYRKDMKDNKLQSQ